MTDPAQKIIAYFNGNFERFITNESKRPGDYDLETMKEIILLAKSQNVQDRLKSLDLFEASSKKFPYGFEGNLFIALKKDSDQQVRDKAKVVEQERRVETFKKIADQWGSVKDLYGETLRDSLKNLNATSIAFSQSQAIANYLPTVMAQPIHSIDLKMIEGWSKSLEVSY